jgi:hypothetical protein
MQYIKERMLRLVVPLIFGAIMVVPACYYYSQLFFNKLFDTTYANVFDWYWNYWLKTALTPFQVLSGGTFAAGALWFLWYLVLYTFVLLPVFRLVYVHLKDTLLLKKAAFFEKTGAMLLPAIPIAAIMVLYNWKWTVGTLHLRLIGWTITGDFQVLYYAVFFIIGFILYSHPGFGKGVDKSGLIAIIAGVVFMTFFMLIVFPVWNKSVLGNWYWVRFRGEPGRAGWVMAQVFYAFTTWTWIIGILYLARRFLNKRNRFVEWGNSAVLPVYIVHSTFIAVLSYYIVQWKTAVFPKYITIVALTYLGSILVLQLAKTNNVTRFLFGIRLKPGRPAEEIGGTGARSE